jgi:flagellar biosynthesis protein
MLAYPRLQANCPRHTNIMVVPDSPATTEAAVLHDRHGDDDMPQTVTGGSNEVARQIIEIARQYGIPIEEGRDLRHLLERLDVGDEIPSQLYAMVAEVLAFAYVVNGKHLDLQCRDHGGPHDASADR